MKKLNCLIAVFVLIASLGFSQEDIMEQAKNGNFYIGANIGMPLSTTSDVSSLNIGADVAYLFEVIDHLKVGGIAGITHYFGDGNYSYTNNGNVLIIDYEDATFLPIAASARYSFADDKFFGGLDLGLAINIAGDAKTGFYARPKFGFNFSNLALIVSYQSISGGTDYKNFNDGNTSNNIVKVSGFNSLNVGVEFSF